MARITKRSLVEKTKLANEYLEQSRNTFAIKEKGKIVDYKRPIKDVENRIRLFNKKKLEIDSKQLTMKGITKDKYSYYNSLLDSILESTYLNPEKYNAYVDYQYNKAIEEGWARNIKEAKKVFEIRHNPIFEELLDAKKEGHSSQILEKPTEYFQNDMSKKDFLDMLKQYNDLYHEANIDKFFKFSDTFLVAGRNYRDEFGKNASLGTLKFKEYMRRYYSV